MADEQSKTIYQLDPISVVQGVDYAQVAFPVQYQQGNFRITLDYTKVLSSRSVYTEGNW